MSCEVIGSMDQKPEDRGIAKKAALEQVVCQVTREGAREEGQKKPYKRWSLCLALCFPICCVTLGKSTPLSEPQFALLFYESTSGLSCQKEVSWSWVSPCP